MENHPIPQDVTGFQFKLIGNMTVKQFAYLAGGAILAWLFFISPFPIFIKLPFSLIFLAGGASFAFVPVEGRPIDVMVLNYIRAFLSPTKYIYNPSDKPISGLPIAPKEKVKIPEQNVHLQSAVAQTQTSQYVEPVAPTPYVFSKQIIEEGEQNTKEPRETKGEKEETPKRELLQEETQLERELVQAKALETQAPENSEQATQAHQKVTTLESQLQEVMEQKKLLEEQLLALNKKLSEQQNILTPGSVGTPNNQTPQVSKTIRTVSPGGEKSAGLPETPEVPNIVTGIIKDPRGNPLSNILVEVKDNAGNPVRAFKTNGLGHFASATPLVNGSYTIEFEDPKGANRFDIVSFSVEGSIILPLEIISTDTREELRRELFN